MRRLIIAAVLAAACGSDSKGSDKGETKSVEGEPADAGRPARKPPSRVLGVAEPSAFNFSYGKGEKPFARVKAAVKKKDWAAANDAAKKPESVAQQLRRFVVAAFVGAAVGAFGSGQVSALLHDLAEQQGAHSQTALLEAASGVLGAGGIPPLEQQPTKMVRRNGKATSVGKT